MLDPKVTELFRKRLLAERASRSDSLDAAVTQIFSEMVSRGALNSTMTSQQVGLVCAKELELRAQFTHKSLLEIFEKLDGTSNPQLLNDLKQELDSCINTDSFFLRAFAKQKADKLTERSEGLAAQEINKRHLVLLDQLNAELELYVESLSRKAAKTTSPTAGEQQAFRWQTTDASQLDVMLPLASKRCFEEDLPLALKECSKTNSLALLMMDLDHFKSVNDNHGHQAGDSVLKATAAVVCNVLVGKGKGYRFGGEELAALLPNTTVVEAIATGERIRSAVEVLSFDDTKLKVTISIGVGCCEDPSTTPNALIETADRYLYEAKKVGRNNVASSSLKPGPSPETREASEPYKPQKATKPRYAKPENAPETDGLSIKALGEYLIDIGENVRTRCGAWIGQRPLEDLLAECMKTYAPYFFHFYGAVKTKGLSDPALDRYYDNPGEIRDVFDFAKHLIRYGNHIQIYDG